MNEQSVVSLPRRLPPSTDELQTLLRSNATLLVLDDLRIDWRFNEAIEADMMRARRALRRSTNAMFDWTGVAFDDGDN